MRAGLLGRVCRSYWWRMAAISLAAAAAVTFLLVLFGGRSTRGSLVVEFFVSLVYSVCIAFSAGAILPRLGPWFFRHRAPVAWMLVGLTLVGNGVAGSLVGGLVLTALGIRSFGEFSATFWASTRVAVVVGLGFGLTVVLYEVMRARLEDTTLALRTQELERERAEKTAVEARLASLESHLQPHFLFNTLNSISALIHDDPARAERMVERLAALLRFSLDAAQHRTVALSEELRIVADYLEIEKARLGDRLRYAVDVAPDLTSMQVPPLSLVTLVENSVKHVVAPRREGGAIGVEARLARGHLVLSVWDSGPGLALENLIPGHGLENLRARLAALFGGEAGLEVASAGGRAAVAISLPAEHRTPARA